MATTLALIVEVNGVAYRWDCPAKETDLCLDILAGGVERPPRDPETGDRPVVDDAALAKECVRKLVNQEMLLDHDVDNPDRSPGRGNSRHDRMIKALGSTPNANDVVNEAHPNVTMRDYRALSAAARKDFQS